MLLRCPLFSTENKFRNTYKIEPVIGFLSNKLAILSGIGVV